MEYIKKSFLNLFIAAIFLTGLSSCSKKDSDKSDRYNEVNEAEFKTVDEKDLFESKEELMSVDYRPFYEELSNSGEWIEVTEDELNSEEGSGTPSGFYNNGRQNRSISYKELFGVKKASADVSMGAFFVWSPSPNLAVSVVAGEPPVYVPYTNGRWVYSDAGWYFYAATPVEEITHHHGRWVYSPSAGWLWVPGRVWAPAWVEWREHEEYIAWSPIPPGIYIRNSIIMPAPVVVERYIIVEKRYFVEPTVYQYVYLGHRHKHKFKIKEWRRLDGLVVVNNTIYDRGPDVTYIRSVSGHQIDEFKVKRVKKFNNVHFGDGSIHTYSPDFRKHKNTRKNVVSKPEKFEKFTEKRNRGRDNFEKGGNLDNNSGDRKLNRDNRFGDYKEKGNIRNENKTNKQREDKNIRNERKNNKQREDKNIRDERKNKQNNEIKKDRKQKGNDRGGNEKIGKERKGNNRSGNDKKSGNDYNGKERKDNNKSKDKRGKR